MFFKRRELNYSIEPSNKLKRTGYRLKKEQKPTRKKEKEGEKNKDKK